MRWLSNSKQVARLHEHRHRAVHVVVDDLDVAVVRAGPPIGDVLVDRLVVRARQHRRGSRSRAWPR